MDYNSRIRWRPGMMLTGELFSQMEAGFTARQQIAVHAAIGAGRCGVLPDTPLHMEGLFVRRVYEMTGLQCMAVLPSGCIISADADFTLPINIASDEDADYYVALGFGEGEHEYERDGVPYVSPEVCLYLLGSEEVEQADVLPIKHLRVREGALSVDEDYIVPVLSPATDTRYETHIHELAQRLKAIASHANMDKGDCKRAMLHYAFLLEAFNRQRSTYELMGLMEEIAQSVDYYIVDSLGATIDEVPEKVTTLRESDRRRLRMTDTGRYIKWLKDYLESQMLIMEKVVIAKPEIDIEALKREIKESLYQDLYEALCAKLLEQLRQQLTEELPEPIIERVKQFLEENLRPELRSQLHTDLRDPLYTDLYEALMEVIKDMLSNLELKEVDNYVPLI